MGILVSPLPLGLSPLSLLPSGSPLSLFHAPLTLELPGHLYLPRIWSQQDSRWGSVQATGGDSWGFSSK